MLSRWFYTSDRFDKQFSVKNMNSLLGLLLLAVSALARPGTNGRIIGGQEAYAGQFPWVAAVYLTTSTGNYFCGGSLVTYQHILTAGQCVDGFVIAFHFYIKKPKLLFIILEPSALPFCWAQISSKEIIKL